MKYLANDLRLLCHHLIKSLRRLGFFHIPVTIRGNRGKHIDHPGFGSIAFTPSRAFGDLRSLILGNHPLKLQQQPLFRRFGRRRLQKLHFGSLPGKFLQEHHLISIIAAQPIRAIDQHPANRSFANQVTQAFQSRPDQSAATVAIVLKLPLRRDGVLMGLRIVQ